MCTPKAEKPKSPPRRFFFIRYKTTQHVNLLSPGTCGPTITSANGCVGTASASLTSPPAISMSILATPTSATITASGGGGTLAYNQTGTTAFVTSPVFNGLLTNTTYIFKSQDGNDGQKSLLKKALRAWQALKWKNFRF